MPTLVSASRTSSSLNGLMIAITIFIRFHPLLLRFPAFRTPSPIPMRAGERPTAFKLRANCRGRALTHCEQRERGGGSHSLFKAIVGRLLKKYANVQKCLFSKLVTQLWAAAAG